MKMSFKQFLIEDARTDFIVSKQGQRLIDAARNDVSASGVRDPQQLIQAMQQMDPSGGKMLQYLVNKYIAGEFRLEDAARVRSALEQFIKKRNTLQLKDINQYKSLHDLYNAVEQAADLDLSKKQQKKQLKSEGADVVIKAPGFMVLHLKTGEAACFYAAGTKWCTSNADTFKSYADRGDIFVIMVKDKKGATRKFQLHYQSGQLMNERDAAPSKSDIALLSSYPQWYEFVDMITRKHWTKY